MAKIEVFDDCLSPARFIFLQYKGKNPFGAYSKIDGMLQRFFMVSSSGTAETDFRWDNVGPDDEFYVRWWVKKKFSSYTTFWTHMVLQGKKNRERNEGEFTLQINGENRTTIDSKNPFLKGLFWIYMYLFYNSRRRDYLKQCNKLLYGLRDEMKEHFNLQELEE